MTLGSCSAALALQVALLNASASASPSRGLWVQRNLVARCPEAGPPLFWREMQPLVGRDQQHSTQHVLQRFPQRGACTTALAKIHHA